ncbi:5-methyltetrahydropteroyltriglutamate--homocysteine S-methyltransferase [Oerskovia turbata]|uniref:5-methyltetrahydropteroyltriglutamate--homocysteine methyltransferase n=1 Tax=Oerskovia turbata TaxID=1713 RepID=A0A4Q1KNB4_9CELL|nr:5-methyltetrahydropteroyltriglutamate--homocysteine S-methyltransferase [Oerskovia turbata]RXR22763.1 5-methyltetrahydropteroyltriglutamate--homocysteine S-methyltransferase [Oerskovia turbata]RXR30709.1 5-methyltetrahydropteroyltriglutamate--homocysteine S-methyltransferase [Oerskovia turbata]TGJ96013.1 5-methyltetrahydropteroyltriglutamate--homocysteine S-methyltransferase [Actinotalea fermentans ATCC 43279 = JCM 9966 = DSM 3133]
MSAPTFPSGSVLGYPRIGPRRELKKAVESFWAGRTAADELEATASALRVAAAKRLVDLGLDASSGAVPGSFSYYDQVLDVVALLGAVPSRFASLTDEKGALDLAGYFTVARGAGEDAPLEMTKWFDTNYHYLVPEISESTPFRFADDRIVRQFVEAKDAGVVTRPVVVGPVTFLALSKAADDSAPGFSPLSRLADVLPVYVELLRALAAAGAPWVQLDEPALVSDSIDVPAAEVHAAVTEAYRVLASELAVGSERPAILVGAPFGGLQGEHDGLALLAATDVEAISLDLVKGAVPAGPVAGLADKTVVAGVVDGHNVWRADLAAKLALVEGLSGLGAGAVTVGTSTSLLHVPHDVEDEDWTTGAIDVRLRDWLAFADQKVGEVAVLARALTEGRDAVGAEIEASRAAVASRAEASGVVVPAVRERAAALTEGDFSRGDYAERAAAQQATLNLPLLPTTTIGSFPQTPEIRRARALNVKGELSDADYTTAMQDEIRRVVELQEQIGLDVLVHGEPERNDMVQYFAENLDGFAVTANGWVQSYGSRCVRPPILWGDVTRPAPITVDWSTFTASLTEKPVKGMLTGPVTILAWSFVRDDQPLGDTANQVGLALRDEIADLEAAGIGIIQVDEPALRELLPLRRADQAAYLDWSVSSFRLATAGVVAETQIHTHLCYSEFGEVIGAIDGLDADVTSVEAARSRMEIVPELAEAGYARGIGPGVYDIHSPRVPSTEEVTDLLELAVKSIDPRLVWVNPDCGLKTRRYEETVASLENLVSATNAVRAQLG